MATSKQKQVSIEKSKNERKWYELRFEAYGGEAVMGSLAKRHMTIGAKDKARLWCIHGRV